MRLATLLFALLLVLCLPASAQKCSEQFVRNTLGHADSRNQAEDAYFFSGALDKPQVGLKSEEATKKWHDIDRSRKNVKQDPLKPDKIFVAPSGDMAYSYGTAHMSFDEVSSGEHVDFTAAFLTVWKVEDGACKIAASMFEPEGKTK